VVDYIRHVKVRLEGGATAVMLDGRDFEALMVAAGYEHHATSTSTVGPEEAFARIQEEAAKERGSTQ